ncbi:uncharacterized protein KRP23_4711 [Phytophthora ramorum]|uniref:uncharacterized protein n=1 Tax=Phytophthora ramorum TaxID=164328 RepID=UPI0030B73687|nr:hypothetical protein KRP23_4711 [Phytophthora ramorum]
MPTSWSGGEPPAPPLSLSIALRDLMAEAEALHDRVDFATFVDIAESPRLPHPRDGQTQWKRVEKAPAFTLLKRGNEVLALARLNASVEEVASILASTTDPLHAATLRCLYGDAFIAGSVAYAQPQRTYDEYQAYRQLTVKTSSFVHSDLLGKNEQWCFAETLRCQSQHESFTLTQATLSAEQAASLPARRAVKDSAHRVAQLLGVTAAYLVEKMTGSHGLRVVFHALYQPDERGHGGSLTVSLKAVRARLLRLARGVAQLSSLVRRRRFGTQVFADRAAFDVRNARCTCCTRKFTPFMMLLPRTRCYLCGYYVCVACSSSEKMEAHNGRLASIIVCSRCRQSVTDCDYEHMLTVLPGPECVLPDEVKTPKQPNAPVSPTSSTSTSELSTFSSASCESPSSLVLAELLGQVVDDDSGPGRRHAALVVLEQLIVADQDETQTQIDKNAKLLRRASGSPHSLQIAAQALDVSKYPTDLAACKFASAASRPYPMIPALICTEDESKEAEPILYPIPANENTRLAAIEHFRLHDITNVSELNVICALAAAEMGCPHSLVTLVEREVVTLLSTNAPENWDVGSGNPREQTFCQHFVMEDQPLLVRHAEADMRFYHIAPVNMRSLRFYAGFPVSVSSVLKSGKAEKVVRDSLRFAKGRALLSLQIGMRAQLHARHLAARPSVARSKHRNSLRQRPSYTALTPPSASTAPIRSALRRAVRVDDRELFRRARRVQRWQDLPRNSSDHTSANLVSQGWRWRRQKKGFELYTRQSPIISITGAPLGPHALPLLLDSEVLAVGNVACSIGQLAQPLRSPSESNYNSLMHTLYGSDFIYGSLVHKATFRRRGSAETVVKGQQRGLGDDRSKQLLVKTCSFVHTSMFNKKNEQLCYAELFSPTSSGGFSISSCSLAAREVIAGKVRAPLRQALHQLHPCSSWFSAEPASSGVHVVFRARFHRSEGDDSCSPKVMNARLWKLAKGVCKLGKLVDSIAQPTRGISSSAHTAGGPRNSRCIVCTRALYHIFMARNCSRCELCSYNVCDACCSQQHVAIYNRHVAPLLVCARCRESLARDEFDSQLRAVDPGAVAI